MKVKDIEISKDQQDKVDGSKGTSNLQVMLQIEDLQIEDLIMYWFVYI